jgi:hypothetical protein
MRRIRYGDSGKIVNHTSETADKMRTSIASHNTSSTDTSNNTDISLQFEQYVSTPNISNGLGAGSGTFVLLVAHHAIR